ncbi:PstA family ABC transporter permease [Patulibacter sp.]|uniref:PstA family ABC transporter permease n=1 Tax=Patulibacter sp. TaxID=1912859 RepID=UPI002717E11D|nr:ABC transporter permease subunit [Patulibacter sp.]MDO9406983.1 ABC transporter permease subunit [Patulibacter sp.]
MSVPGTTGPGATPPGRRQRLLGELRLWRPLDLAGVAAAWLVGLLLVLVAGTLLLYMGYKGLQYVNLDLLVSRPQPGSDQSQTGGILDPIVGTLLIIVIATAIALPLAVGAALWIVEYGRPRWLARVVESGIEVIAGAPSIAIAIFGLAIFQLPLFGWASFAADGGGVFGRSFIAAGTVMSLIALPSIFATTREALQSVPRHVREASYGLGKTRWATIRRVLLPTVRPDIATGTALGMGRIAGDTAIIVLLLGATLQLQAGSDIPGVGTLQGTGSTLTSYVYNNSPTGEGNAPEKAYAAAFVLMLLIIGLNLLVAFIGRRRAGNDLPR